MMRRTVFSVLLVLFALPWLHAQVTNIPDPEFEQALIDLKIDTDATLNGEVLTADIDTIEQLSISNRNISNLTGIEDFVNLTSLNCSGNRIGNLNVTANTNLQTLICSSNQLTTLNLVNNANLKTLLCSSNELAGLNLTQNDSLLLLDCSGNQLVTLDISTNRLLENLNCSANKLTNLDVGQNDSLIALTCSNNLLTQLEVDTNFKLERLICASNQLGKLNVSANPQLVTLDYSSNLIVSHDLSDNTQLSTLNCSDNLLRYLNISNGNNQALLNFNAKNNPLLLCIEVDDTAETGLEWEKDNTAAYSTSCDPIQTPIPDNNFELALIALGLDAGPPNGFVVTDSISSLTGLNVAGENITDLTGIGDFVALATLNCSDNQITSLDLTKNTALISVDCSDNDLNSLNLKNNSNNLITNMDARGNEASLCIAVDNGFTPGAGWLKDGGATFNENCNAGQTFVPDDNFEQALIDLGLDAGPLDNYVLTANLNAETSLNVSGKYISDLTGIEDFTALESLDCSENLLTSLDVSANAALTELRCFSNYLTELEVESNTALVSLNCGDNLLDSLDVTQNAALEDLIFDSNSLTGIDLSNNGNLVNVNANSNKIVDAGFDLSPAINLEKLFCSNNKLTTLDLPDNPALVELDCSNNKINLLGLTANVNLEKVDCSQNFLTSLSLNTNVVLDTLIANSNQLGALTLDSNPLLRMLSVNGNSLSGINLNSNDSLRYLSISGNNLTALNLDNNEELLHLNCSDNQLDDLDVINNGNLLFISCSENNLTDLDISQNVVLLSLFADRNMLDTLNTSNNPDLVNLSVANNQIDSLDLSANAFLVSLICNGNELTELALENNTELTELVCSGNEITSLDVSLQPNLTLLNCASNKLTRLNLRNGNNDTLEVFNALVNPDLLCIEVDDPGNIGSEWQKDNIASYSGNCRYDETYVPDDNFEAALAAITGEPDDNDDYILTSAISNLTSLDVSNAGISDLTGIQNFVALQVLDISNNSLDSVYLNNNPDLRNINAAVNQFVKFDFSNNILLEAIDVSGNSLTSIFLDSLSSLSAFSCNGNNISELNLTNNTNLVSLNCSDNELKFLRVNNGNNSNLITFDATENPDLFCIQIDDEASIGAAWLKDDIASYSENCHYNETYIPDPAFEQALIDFGYDYSNTGPLDGYVPTARINQIAILNVRDRDIEDFTGIEDFDALTSLNCSDNLLTSLDISENLHLRILNCSGNKLSSLDISLNTALVDLNASKNNLTQLNLDQNTGLIKINASSNQLTGLNLVPNINLKEVNATQNKLVTVDANNGFNDSLAVFDLRGNATLTCILIDDIAAANNYSGWSKDEQAAYKLVCDDDDNDGVPDTDDLCPTTPPGAQVDLFGCTVFSLPVNNFTIRTTSETCRTGNNGKINITAAQVHPFVATLTGSLDTIDYEFFDKVEIRNVRADTYQLCIRVIGEGGYEQCYTLVLTEPDYLRVTPAGSMNGGRVAYSLSGNDAYIVEINGLEFTTTEDYISLGLEKGRNEIRIRTKAECQGVFEETIYLSEEPLLFPNPFTNHLRVVLGTGNAEDMQVNLYTASGNLIKSTVYGTRHGQLEIDTSELSAGIYIIEVSGKDFQSKFKAVKK